VAISVSLYSGYTLRSSGSILRGAALSGMDATVASRPLESPCAFKPLQILGTRGVEGSCRRFVEFSNQRLQSTSSLAFLRDRRTPSEFKQSCVPLGALRTSLKTRLRSFESFAGPDSRHKAFTRASGYERNNRVNPIPQQQREPQMRTPK